MMHARIGMMRAINRHIERVFDPSRKDKHWGKAEIEERPMTKPGLFRRLDAGIDRRSCHATIVAIRPPGGCTPSVLGLGAAVVLMSSGALIQVVEHFGGLA